MPTSGLCHLVLLQARPKRIKIPAEIIAGMPELGAGKPIVNHVGLGAVPECAVAEAMNAAVIAVARAIEIDAARAVAMLYVPDMIIVEEPRLGIAARWKAKPEMIVGS